MEVTSCFLAIYLVEALIFLIYCDNLLYTKGTLTIRRYALVLTGYITMFAFSFFKSVIANFLSFFLINLLLIFILYQTTIFMAAFHSILLTIMMGMSELICDSTLLHISHNFFTTITVNFPLFVLYASVSKFLYLIVILIIATKSKKNKDNPSPATSGDFMLFIIPAFSSFIMLTFTFIGYYATFSKWIGQMIAISTFLILIINICVFSFYRYSKNRQQQFYELQLQLQRESDMFKYNKILMGQSENQHILIHDIKKHLNSLSYLNQQHAYEKIDSYIAHLLDSSSLKTSLKVCDHPLLNAILYRYQAMASEKGIHFYTDIRSKCLDFMSENDLTSLFCNLLDNAFEAASLADSGRMELTVSRANHDAPVLITLVNSCLQSPFSSKKGNLSIKRKNSPFHGFGIKSIQNIVTGYHGDISMYYKDDDHTFHTIITLS